MTTMKSRVAEILRPRENTCDVRMTVWEDEYRPMLTLLQEAIEALEKIAKHKSFAEKEIKICSLGFDFEQTAEHAARAVLEKWER